VRTAHAWAEMRLLAAHIFQLSFLSDMLGRDSGSSVLIKTYLK
jgi:hypothetical protein